MTLAEELAAVAIKTKAEQDEALRREAEAAAIQRVAAAEAESQELYNMIIASCRQRAATGERVYRVYMFVHSPEAIALVRPRLTADGFALEDREMYLYISW